MIPNSVAMALPPSYVFEGMRALLIQNVFRADLMIDALEFHQTGYDGMHRTAILP